MVYPIHFDKTAHELSPLLTYLFNSSIFGFRRSSYRLALG